MKDSSIKSFMNINNLLFHKNSMTIPINLYFFLSIRWVRQKFMLFPKLSLRLHVYQCEVRYCPHHTNILYNVYLMWWCLLCTYHMDWSRTHVISESLFIFHTIILQTSWNHIKFSIVIVIVTSRHFTHTISSVLWVHL